MGSSPKPYLTFRVARQDLAMEAACIRGILPLTDLEPAAAGRSGLLGITSLKGQVVSVIDLRRRLQLPHASQGSQPKIVVLELTAGTRQHLLGFVADRISDVVVYRDRDLRSGALRGKGRPRKLVDFDQLVSENELAALCTLSP
ncbi:MAG TPA: chemotaxis protein CheW [Bryobacteraceae bacterium]|nr:chemotaxis protein CheW [Bryobacteraceae bacterium]